MKHTKDFNRKTVTALKAKGITIYSRTWLPAASGELPYANGETGYIVNDKGTSRVWTFLQVLENAGTK